MNTSTFVKTSTRIPTSAVILAAVLAAGYLLWPNAATAKSASDSVKEKAQVKVQAKGQAKAAKRDLSGKTIVITGASSGFGEGAARAFAARGANVVLAARRGDVLDKIAAECGPNTLVVATDVSKAEQVKALSEAALARFKHIDVWINNAGVGAFGRFTDIPLADQARMIDINLTGVVNGSHFAVSQFKKQGHGTLINVASMAGKIPIAYYATYSATKFGVVGFDDALRAELKADKLKDIHVCTVNPLPTNTPFWTNGANYTGHKINPGAMHEPDIVIDAISDLVLHPKDEVNVGLKAKVAVRGHRLAPRSVEDNYGEYLRKIHFEEGASAPPSSGTLYRPVESGVQ
ncbi:MAG: SDR family NAD(P)-dependent oxidoreductase [Candidatus Obscuribacterales bacterium]